MRVHNKLRFKSGVPFWSGRRDTRRSTALGFTLVELMVVLALIGILTAMIIPEMKGSLGDAVLRSSGRDLVNVFTLASSRAITLNRMQRVHFDMAGGRYVMERRVRPGEGDESFAPVRDVPGGHGKIDSRIRMDLRRPGQDTSDPSDQTEAASQEPADNAPPRSPAIGFYPDGTADEGEVLLQDREGFRLALRINPVTSHIDIVELERQ